MCQPVHLNWLIQCVSHPYIGSSSCVSSLIYIYILLLPKHFQHSSSFSELLHFIIVIVIMIGHQRGSHTTATLLHDHHHHDNYHTTKYHQQMKGQTPNTLYKTLSVMMGVWSLRLCSLYPKQTKTENIFRIPK